MLHLTLGGVATNVWYQRFRQVLVSQPRSDLPLKRLWLPLLTHGDVWFQGLDTLQESHPLLKHYIYNVWAAAVNPFHVWYQKL